MVSILHCSVCSCRSSILRNCCDTTLLQKHLIIIVPVDVSASAKGVDSPTNWDHQGLTANSNNFSNQITIETECLGS